jgi:hypothetical protein
MARVSRKKYRFREIYSLLDRKLATTSGLREAKCPAESKNGLESNKSYFWK